jgi:hypothetical protein
MEHHENGAFQPDDHPQSSRLSEPLSNVTNPFTDPTDEEIPLLESEQTTAFVQSPEDYSEPNPRLNGGKITEKLINNLSIVLAQTVSCRVCDNQIVYQNKTMQHVVR